MASVYLGLAAVTGFALYVYDTRVSKRILAELPYLETIHTDAIAQAQTASPQGYIFAPSERHIFERVQAEAAWMIHQRKTYFQRVPLVRVLYAAPTTARPTMGYVFSRICMDEDGDFYDSYASFVNAHK